MPYTLSLLALPNELDAPSELAVRSCDNQAVYLEDATGHHFSRVGTIPSYQKSTELIAIIVRTIYDLWVLMFGENHS